MTRLECNDSYHLRACVEWCGGSLRRFNVERITRIGSVYSARTGSHVYTGNCTICGVIFLVRRTVEGARIATEFKRAELHVEKSDSTIYSVAWHLYSARWDL